MKENVFLYIAGYISLATTVENLNPYIIFFGGVIAILVGIANLIKFYFFLLNRFLKKDEDKNH